MLRPSLFARRIWLIAVVLLTWPALAGTEATFPHGSIELIIETTSIEPGRSIQAGLYFRLEKGWHIYWSNPGDAGEPPRITWDLPSGMVAGKVQWPYPRLISAFSAVDYGYEDEVLLIVPIQVGPELPVGKAVDLNANVRFVVCREVCLPGKSQLTARLPAVAGTPPLSPATKGIFRVSRQKLPVAVPKTWTFTAIAQKDYFQVAAKLGRRVGQAIFFPSEADQIENAAPQTLRPTSSGFAMTLKKSNRLLRPVQHLEGVLLVEGKKAYFIDIAVH